MTEIFDNIRKLYQFDAPTNELADYIEFFSESSASETYRYVADQPFTIRMFPSWTPTFYINLGPTYQLLAGNSQYLISQQTNILILRNNIVERQNLPTDSIFTVKFFPGGLEAIMGINQVQFIDRVVHLETVLPLTIIQRVKQLACFEERVEWLQHYFLSQFQQQKKADHYRQFVLDTIGTFNNSGMVLNSVQLADRLFATSKTINRYFRRVIGTPPKQYLATLRARAALSSYLAYTNTFFPEEYGYYDRSHFYKDVVRLTGEKLSQHLG